MKVFLSHVGGNVFIQARPESDDSVALVGDVSRTLQPGEDFFGNSFADIHALGEGEHDITEKETA